MLLTKIRYSPKLEEAEKVKEKIEVWCKENGFAKSGGMVTFYSFSKER